MTKEQHKKNPWRWRAAAAALWLLQLAMAAGLAIPAQAQSFTEGFDGIGSLTGGPPGGGWFMQNNSSPLGSSSWFQGDTAQFPSYNGASDSYISANSDNAASGGAISDWLVTPNRTFRNGDVLTFYTRNLASGTDRLEVRMSTNGASTNVGTGATLVGDFLTLLLSVNPTLVTGVYPSTWTQYTITISGLPAPTSGRIGFRYFVPSTAQATASTIGIDQAVYTPYVCPAFTMTPGPVIAGGNFREALSRTLTQFGALGAPNFAVTGGALPPGITLSAGGTISGTPTAAGTFHVTITVSDASGCSGSTAYTMTIAAIVPDAPSIGTLTGGDGQVTVSWTPPDIDGGDPVIDYTVTAVEDPARTCTTSTSTSCTVMGLTNGTAYSFKVQARNGVGSSLAATSGQVTPAGLPGAPTLTGVTPGDRQVTVSFTPPAVTGGISLINHTVTATTVPGGVTTTTTGTASPITFTGLTNGTAYTFSVTATNAVGPGAASATSAAVTPTAPPPPSGPSGPSTVQVNQSGSAVTITDPSIPIVVGPDAAGATILVSATGTTPLALQITVNGQPLQVQAQPGTQFQATRAANGQIVLVVGQGAASMVSSAAGQPMAVVGGTLLSAGSAGTRIESQPQVIAVVSGSLLPPQGSLPQLGSQGLQAGERLQLDAQGQPTATMLGSPTGDAQQVGDGMAFTNLPASITVDGSAFARLAGPVARLAGASLAQGLETAPSGVVLVRDGSQILQLLPVRPIGIDARLPDGISFTPLGLLRWVRSGVVLQFAPAVADLAGLARAITAVLPDAQIKLGSEGVLQLRTGGHTYVLRPDWAGGGAASSGTPQIGVDGQGRIFLQNNGAARQLLLPSLLSPTETQAVLGNALPGATLAVQGSASDGAVVVNWAGLAWRLVPQWVLPDNAQQALPWRLGADGVLYLRLGTQVQGVQISD